MGGDWLAGRLAPRQRRSRACRGLAWFGAAAGVGGVHALASLYWALGGDWLINTVGRWAVDWRNRRPNEVALILSLIVVMKTAGCVVPLLNAAGRLPAPQLWRGLSWCGAIGLIGYGGINTLAAWATLAGLLSEDPIDDPGALLGHAALWDPLFLLWGVFLLLGLRASRPSREGPPSEPGDTTRASHPRNQPSS